MSNLGRVSSVVVDQELNKIFVSVVSGPSKEHRNIQFIGSKPSFWLVPEEGDLVEVYQSDREWYARFPHSTTQLEIPDLQSGDVCLKLDESTELRFQKNESDNYDVTIRASGEINIESADSVVIGDPNSAVNVAVQDHTHTDSQGGNTSTPNEVGTKTKIE